MFDYLGWMDGWNGWFEMGEGKKGRRVDEKKDVTVDSRWGGWECEYAVLNSLGMRSCMFGRFACFR